MGTEMPRSYKEIQMIRAMEAKDLATISAAMDHNIAGRHRIVLGLLADGEFKERKKIAFPMMRKMALAEKTLNKNYMIWFKDYWRLRNRYERAGRSRKSDDIDRDILFYEPSYRWFESEHDDARIIIDAVYNQPGMLKTLMGVETAEDEGAGKGMLLLATPERIEAKHKAKRMMEKEALVGSERDKPFSFPTFREALEIARKEVAAEEGIPEPQKTASRKRKKRSTEKRMKKAAKPGPARKTAAAESSGISNAF